MEKKLYTVQYGSESREIAADNDREAWAVFCDTLKIWPSPKAGKVFCDGKQVYPKEAGQSVAPAAAPAPAGPAAPKLASQVQSAPATAAPQSAGPAAAGKSK